MNRIETKIIIMITNRLAEAKESNAKTEMIEELSENLYQRYLELAANGIPEEVALQRAMDSLGDVEELLAFLKEEEAEEAVNNQETISGDKTSREEGSTSFFKEDLESGIEEIVNAALSTAKGAVDCAKDVAKEVSDQLKERYPEGVFRQFTARRGQKVDCTAIPSEGIYSLEIHLTNGNVEISCVDEENSFIEVSGDTEEIETMLKDDDVLSISQGNTASAAYFFMRGMRRSDIRITLPKKAWDRICVSTVNGDINIGEKLVCRELKVSTTSGDLDMKQISGNTMVFHSSSGDITGKDLDGNLYAETRSGDIELNGRYGKCELFSASGDVRLEGECEELTSSSTSGDVVLDIERLPKKVKANSISGNCEIKIPAEKGFHISYRTVSGKFMTNLPFTGTLGEKCGDAICGEEENGKLQLSSVSGDICVWSME